MGNKTLGRAALAVAVGMAMGLAQADDIQEVKIGFAGPLTGPSAHQGQDVEHGVAIAIEQANQQQLKIGNKVAKFVLVSEDDVADSRTGTAYRQGLADEVNKAVKADDGDIVVREFTNARPPTSTPSSPPSRPGKPMRCSSQPSTIRQRRWCGR